ncbi:MAG: tol-pal system protein YbgF [Bacteroidota bacterium]
MSNDPRNARNVRLFLIPGFIALGLGVLAAGCASEEETMDEWETPPEASPTASLEYRIDSLKNENRRMKEQLDAMAAENRSLTGRNAELETKLAEASAAPKATPAPVTPSGDLTSAYSAALDQFRQRNFQDAIQQFEGILQAGADNKLADNCHYWIGESYYGMRRYNDAIRQFETVLGYEGSGKRPYAQLMIGNAYAALGDKAAAREAYDKVVSTYPASDIVEKAKDKLAKLR